MSLSNPAVVTRASGSYTGNDSANRAIPHGLGRVPGIIHIKGTANNDDFFISNGYILKHPNAAVHASGGGITAPTSSNFYVGNAASYSNSANANTVAYEWSAI